MKKNTTFFSLILLLLGTQLSAQQTKPDRIAQLKLAKSILADQNLKYVDSLPERSSKKVSMREVATHKFGPEISIHSSKPHWKSGPKRTLEGLF